MQKSKARQNNSTLNDRDLDHLGYNYNKVDRSDNDKKLSAYNQHVLKNLELKTLKPMAMDYQ